MKSSIYLTLITTMMLSAGCDQGNKPATFAMRKNVGIGLPAPDFTLRDLQEKNVSLSDFKGKVLILTFWKVKCKDCIKTLPTIESLNTKLNNPDLAVLTIDVDNLEYVKPEKIHAFLKENHLTFRVGVDEIFSASEAYNILAVPMTYLVDKKGVISDIKFGETDWTSKENMEKVQALL